MDFLGIGPLEFVLIAIVFLVVMGPDKLPVYGRKLGEFIGRARRTVNEAKDALTEETRDVEQGAKGVGESVRKTVDLPPSPDFDLTFNFDPEPGSRGASAASDAAKGKPGGGASAR
ncbi:MAG: twin-arginine translocase TatA/TatE family subunit [Chloroflexi bacterium]|nr:twin-arginine translocase TatA/TatE family subunit [Chloroflexota bacterium]